MIFLRNYAAAYIRTLRRNLAFDRAELSRMRATIAAQQDAVAQIRQAHSEARTEVQRISTLLDAERIRCKELEVDKALLARENELLAMVVERQHKRVESEIALHCRTIEGDATNGT